MLLTYYAPRLALSVWIYYIIKKEEEFPYPKI